MKRPLWGAKFKTPVVERAGHRWVWNLRGGRFICCLSPCHSHCHHSHCFCWLRSLHFPSCLCLSHTFQNLQNTGQSSKQAIQNPNNWKHEFNCWSWCGSQSSSSSSSITQQLVGNVESWAQPTPTGQNIRRSQVICIHISIWEVPLWPLIPIKDLNYGFFLDNGKYHGDMKTAHCT